MGQWGRSFDKWTTLYISDSFAMLKFIIYMSQPPSTTIPDSTIALATDGYKFISKRCKKYNTNIF